MLAYSYNTSVFKQGFVIAFSVSCIPTRKRAPLKFTGKLLAGLVGGLIVGTLSYFMAAMMFIESFTGAKKMEAMVFGAFGVSLLLAILLAFTSQTVGRAWRKVLLLCAAASAFIPISTLVSSAGQVYGDAKADAATVVGSAIGGGIVTTFSAIVGLALAAVFLIIALLCGRETRVVYVERGNQIDYRDSDLLK